MTEHYYYPEQAWLDTVEREAKTPCQWNSKKQALTDEERLIGWFEAVEDQWILEDPHVEHAEKESEYIRRCWVFHLIVALHILL